MYLKRYDNKEGQVTLIGRSTVRCKYEFVERKFDQSKQNDVL